MILIFRNFLLQMGLPSKSFFILFVTLVQISLHFFNKLSSTVKKHIHLVPPLWLLICTRFWKNYTEWFNFITTEVTTEIFICFLARRNLFKYKCVINIYIILNNRLFIAVKLMSFNFNIIKLYNSFVHILYMIINFCVSLCSTFFSLKSTLF